MFSIELYGETFHDDGVPYAKGRIALGDFQETFHAYLNYWQRSDYLRHWRAAVDRILRGEKRSALVTSMHNPKTSSHIVWWPMWRSGEVVYVRNQLLFMDKLKSPLDPEAPFAHVPSRRAPAKEKPSEWVLKVDDLRDFTKKASGSI